MIPDFAETNNRDTDGDGFTDAEEVLAGTDPLNAQNNILTLNPGLIGGGQPGTGGPGTGGPGPGNTEPNPDYRLIWMGPNVQASWTKDKRWDINAKKSLTTHSGNITHYPKGDKEKKIEYFNETDGKTVPKISELARKCVFPPENLFFDFATNSLGPLAQSSITSTVTNATGSTNSIAQKNWFHRKAQIAVVTPYPVKDLVELPQGASLTCLRIKTTREGTAPIKTEVIGNYTFTIPKGKDRSNVFPIMLSYSLQNPVDADGDYTVSYSLLPVEIKVNQPDNHLGPNGCARSFYTAPKSGNARGLFCIWPTESAFIELKGLSGHEQQIPITWHSDSAAGADQSDKLNHEAVWMEVECTLKVDPRVMRV